MSNLQGKPAGVLTQLCMPPANSLAMREVEFLDVNRGNFWIGGVE